MNPLRPWETCREQSALARFVDEHPWMTFFLTLSAINGIVIIARGKDAAPALVRMYTTSKGKFEP